MNDDLIRRETIIRALDKSISGMREVAAGDRIMTKAIKLVQIARDFADNLPAVDAVEVVRCKDCRMAAMLRKPKGEVIADCMLRKFHTDDEDFIEVRGDDFCSYGVRRKDDG